MWWLPLISTPAVDFNAGYKCKVETEEKEEENVEYPMQGKLDSIIDIVSK
jgi:hypothetical protein